MKIVATKMINRTNTQFNQDLGGLYREDEGLAMEVGYAIREVMERNGWEVQIKIMAEITL